MVFIHDTEQSLRAAAFLVNTLPGYDGVDALATQEDFDAYLRVNPYTGVIRHDDAELAAAFRTCAYEWHCLRRRHE